MWVEYKKQLINMDFVFNFYSDENKYLVFESDRRSVSFNDIRSEEAYEHIIQAMINNSPFLNLDEYEMKGKRKK